MPAFYMGESAYPDCSICDPARNLGKAVVECPSIQKPAAHMGDWDIAPGSWF